MPAAWAGRAALVVVATHGAPSSLSSRQRHGQGVLTATAVLTSSRKTGRWAPLLPPASFTPFIACSAGCEEQRAEDHTPSMLRSYRDGEHRLGHTLISSLRSVVASVTKDGTEVNIRTPTPALPPSCRSAAEIWVEEREGHFFVFHLGWYPKWVLGLGQLLEAWFWYARHCLGRIFRFGCSVGVNLTYFPSWNTSPKGENFTKATFGSNWNFCQP